MIWSSEKIIYTELSVVTDTSPDISEHNLFPSEGREKELSTFSSY